MTELQHWKHESDAQGLFWLALDRADESTNSLSSEVLVELNSALVGIEANPPKGLVILSGKENGFIAGADIKGFADLVDSPDLASIVKQGQGVFNRLANLPVPTLAMINGFCLGGGLELALACDYRIATEDAKLGLPEVKLGIHPGFGGTVRLSNLLPAPQAMDIMLTGRNLRASAALKLGLVDKVVPLDQLRATAASLVSSGQTPASGNWKTKLLNLAPARMILSKVLRKQVSKKARPEQYPAPFAIIDLWEKHGGNADAMMEAEADSIARLFKTDTSRNLIRVFFLQERMKSLGRTSDSIKQVHVIGAGVMGADIAAWATAQGFAVTLQDSNAEALERARERARKMFERKLKTESKIQAGLDRLKSDVEGKGVEQADLVIEAIFENLEAKQNLYRAIEPRMKPDAILASNTSSIRLEALAESLQNPSRLIGLHFFNPVAQMPLVEIVLGESTSDEIRQRSIDFTRSIDRLPVPVKSAPGFLVNRVLTAYMLEAMKLMEDGLSAEAVDAIAERFGMPMGPVELADTVGLDVGLHVGEILAAELGGEVPESLRAMIEAGNKGKKTGRGFYRWEKGKPLKNPADSAEIASAADAEDRLILAYLNACMSCLRENVVEDADLLDAGMIFGSGFAPFRGGPMHYAAQRGHDQINARLEEFSSKYGERFAPDIAWNQS